MSETQLDRLERKFDMFVVEVYDRFDRLETRMDRLEVRMDRMEVRMDRMEIWMGRMEDEMRARFESIERRLGILERATIEMRTVLAGVQKDVIELRTRLDASFTLTDQNIRELREDMQQRFRIVNERIGEVEKRLAA